MVFGHSLELYKDKSLLIGIIYVFIYLFHMPVFVFVSGYFSKNVDKSRSKAFRNFFVPYLIFNTIWGLVSLPYVGSFSILTPGWSLWYLMSMFFWRISLKDIVRVRYILPISFVIGTIVGLSSEFDNVLSLSRTLFFLPFFLAGYYTTEAKLLNLRDKRYLGKILIVLIAFIAAILITCSNILPTEFFYGSNSFSSFSLMLWLGILGRIFLYIIGFSFIYILINFVNNSETFFSKVGFNTFSVYILHTYLILLVFAINYFVPWTMLQLLICFVTSILITYILSRNIVMKYFNKLINNFVSFFAIKQVNNKN